MWTWLPGLLRTGSTRWCPGPAEEHEKMLDIPGASVKVLTDRKFTDDRRVCLGAL